MLAERIIIIGVNHKTAPVAVREKLALSGEAESVFSRLREIPGCEECCFLSTCNRVEVIVSSNAPEKTVPGILAFLFSGSTLSPEEAKRYTYLHQGGDAITHLFRVAASLDSMIVGEPQILGQLKEAYRNASEHAGTGVILNRLLHKAFSVAKRIRTETKIGSSAVSISYAAVQLAKKIFGDLQDKKVLLVGAGEMAELAAEHLVNQGIGEVVVANRTLERAVTLARRFNGSAVALTEIVTQLELVDIMISSTGSDDLILREHEVRPLMRRRKNRPLFLIDIAVPRDLDPALNELDNVYLYDIDDLSTVVEGNKSEREKEATKAERIVAEETLKFRQWLRGMEVTPLITALRKKGEEISARELERTLTSLGDISEQQKKLVETMAIAMVNKLLHDPILFLKAETPPEEKQQKLAMIRKIFGLDNS